jgi:hypothetical protein
MLKMRVEFDPAWRDLVWTRLAIANEIREEAEWRRREEMANKLAWRPIDTAEKKDGELVLLSDGDQVEPAEWLDWGGPTRGLWNFLRAGVDFEPTYWMPLPTAPYKDDKHAGHSTEDDGA